MSSPVRGRVLSAQAREPLRVASRVLTALLPTPEDQWPPADGPVIEKAWPDRGTPLFSDDRRAWVTLDRCSSSRGAVQHLCKQSARRCWSAAPPEQEGDVDASAVVRVRVPLAAVSRAGTIALATVHASW
jgi:hypothetical protein